MAIGKNLPGRDKRRMRIRKKVHGTQERPRMSVFRSTKHIYVQVIDDDKGVTLASASTAIADMRAAKGKKSERAKLVGEAIAAACKAKSIDKVVFDRGGYRYHGRVKAIAEAAREAGLGF